MKTAREYLATAKDNLLMTAVVCLSLSMGVAGAALSRSEAGEALAASATPAAMTPAAIEVYREPAIIVTAPRINRVPAA